MSNETKASDLSMSENYTANDERLDTYSVIGRATGKTVTSVTAKDMLNYKPTIKVEGKQ